MKAIKIVGALFGLVLISLVAIVIYISTLDPNAYKGMIADKFTAETGRTLTMDGDIRLTYYPWLGLELNNVTIGNAAGFGEEPFFRTDLAMVRVKLMPLLRDQYEIDTVRLHGTTINLAKDANGVTNWADLAKGDAAADNSNESGLPLAAVILGGVDIQNANLSFDDKSTGTLYNINNMAMSTGELVYGEPIQFNLTLNAKANKPELGADVKLAGTVVYDLDNETFAITPLELVTTLTGPNVPNRSADINLKTAININLADETLAISDLTFDALGTNLTGTINATNIQSATPSYQTNLKLTGNDLALLFKVAEIEPLATQIARLNNRSFDFSAAVNADMQRGDMDVSGLQANLLGASITGDIKASNIQSDTPAVRGTLNASGPDLPTLMQVLGQVQGGADSALTQYGTKLARVPNKAFVMNANFDADMSTGNVKVPVLTVDALGVKLGGTLTATDMQKSGGSINGQLDLAADNPQALLTALDQADLGEVTQSINLKAAVSGNRADLKINPLDLNVVLAGDKIPNSPVNLGLNADTRVNLDKETLALENFKLTGLGLDMSGKVNASNILQSPEFNGDVNIAEFSLRKFMQQLNQEMPVTADAMVYEKVSFATTFDGAANRINVSKLALVLDDTNLNGTLSVTDFENPAVQFGINIDQINADRYLPPPPPDGQNRPVTPETAAGAAAQLPIETLRGLNAKGDLKIGQLVISKAKMSDIVLSLDAKDGRINLAPVAANLYEGTYSGDIGLDATAALPVVNFKSTLQGVKIEPLMTDFTGAANVSGTGNIEMTVTATGADTTALKHSLSGNGKIALEEGILRGVDVAKVLEQIEIMIESKRPMDIDRGVETPFDTFTSTLDINNGVVASNDLMIKAPGLQVSGKGTVINLVNDTLDYTLIASADASSVTQGTERYNIGGYTVPIRCNGLVNSPKCVPDAGEIIKFAVQKAVEKKLGDVLQRAIGLPAQQQQQPASEPAPAEPTTDSSQAPSLDPAAAPAEQPQEQPQEAPPADPREILLNKALESIFKR